MRETELSNLREAGYNDGVRTLKQCLLDYDLVMLRAIAERWEIELAASRPHDAAVELAKRMTAPSAQTALAALLAPAEREALNVVLAEGGQMPVGAFMRRFGEIRLMGPGRLERERPWTNPNNAAESLWYTGLIYRTFDEGPGGMHEVIYVPPELRTLVQAQVAAPAQPVIPLASPPNHAAGQAGGIADDMCTLLAWAHQHLLAATPCNAGWRRRHALLIVQLAPHRLADSFESESVVQDYIEFLVHLASQSGLLRREGERLRPVPEPTLQWLRAPLFEQIRFLFDAWRSDATWNELWRVPGLRCEDTGSWYNDPLAARATVIEFLAGVEPGVWYSLEGFVATIKAQRPDFQRPGGDYTTWYIRDAQSGEYLRGFKNWDAVEGALVRYLLTGPLAWLGVVEVGGRRAEVGWRMAELGAALLGKGEPSIRDGDARFEVSGEGLVHVGKARRFERFQLSRVADWRRVEEHVWVYRLVPSSLERARAQRIDVERIIRFLEENSGQPVPRTLSKALRRWQEKGAEAWAGEAVILRVAQPELLEQLLHAPATRRLIRETLSSTTAAVAPDNWPALQRALLEMGVMVEGGKWKEVECQTRRKPGSMSISSPERSPA